MDPLLSAVRARPNEEPMPLLLDWALGQEDRISSSLAVGRPPRNLTPVIEELLSQILLWFLDVEEGGVGMRWT